MFGRRGVLQVAVPTGMQGFPVFDVTADGGRTWTARTQREDMAYSNTGYPLLLAASDADHWHVALWSTVWTTSDAERHWTKRDHGAGMTQSLSFPTPNVGWAAVSNDGEDKWKLLSTSDGGKTWRDVTVPGL